ncbi:SGNH family hydrolase [Bosea sp. UNC402CLCol]|uniref:SGNH/GDSL hydrolase family protein n=1 Tax=Bosea sp. UNC402CLCol TaxID=1510531 RepID=UPI0009E009D2|nr:SGNH family hydrolase [Bosea sp. UNC402CLCol]
MRLRSLVMVLCSACLLLLTGGPVSLAQQPPQQQRSLFQLFWQLPARPAVQPQQPRLRPSPAPVVRRSRAAAPVVVRDDPVIPKVDVTNHIVVMGDSLANLLADGLDEALNDRPDVEVTHRTKPDSGLVRTDFYDWQRAVTDLLASDQKITIAVMMVGLNDRQPIREGDIVQEPLSPRWLELYRDRVDALATAFAAKRIPLIWVGVPPVQNARLSADLVTLNELYRERAEKAGGQYVDLWGGFVDSENRYTATGPDVSGQPTRLRLGDGVHFTKAGARKAAHFVDLVIRRIIEQAPQSNVIALPVAPDTGAPTAPELQPGGVERLIDQMAAGLPAIGLPQALQARPLAGPIQPLTGQAAPSAQPLLASITEARGRGDAADQLERVFGQGIAPEPVPGRIDDYRWPR